VWLRRPWWKRKRSVIVALTDGKEGEPFPRKFGKRGVREGKKRREQSIPLGPEKRGIA